MNAELARVDALTRSVFERGRALEANTIFKPSVDSAYAQVGPYRLFRSDYYVRDRPAARAAAVQLRADLLELRRIAAATSNTALRDAITGVHGLQFAHISPGIWVEWLADLDGQRQFLTRSHDRDVVAMLGDLDHAVGGSRVPNGLDVDQFLVLADPAAYRPPYSGSNGVATVGSTTSQWAQRVRTAVVETTGASFEDLALGAARRTRHLENQGIALGVGVGAVIVGTLAAWALLGEHDRRG